MIDILIMYLVCLALILADYLATRGLIEVNPLIRSLGLKASVGITFLLATLLFLISFQGAIGYLVGFYGFIPVIAVRFAVVLSNINQRRR